MLFHGGQVAFLLFQLLWEDEEQSDEEGIAERASGERLQRRRTGISFTTFTRGKRETREGKSKSKSPSHSQQSNRARIAFSAKSRLGLDFGPQLCTNLKEMEPKRCSKTSLFCDVRESNPGQLLGRQLCSPLYQHRLMNN